MYLQLVNEIYSILATNYTVVCIYISYHGISYHRIQTAHLPLYIHTILNAQTLGARRAEHHHISRTSPAIAVHSRRTIRSSEYFNKLNGISANNS